MRESLKPSGRSSRSRGRVAPLVLLVGALIGLTGALLNGDWLIAAVFAVVGIVAVVWAIRMGR
jgi:hypothetical protein